MISASDKEKFVRSVEDGASFEEACSSSGISRRSAFRFLDADPSMRGRYDRAVDGRKAREREEADRKGMDELKRMVKDRR